MKKVRFSSTWLQRLSPVLVLLAWESAARNNFISPLFFPAPSAIGARLWQLLTDSPVFLGEIGSTYLRLFWGCLIAVPFAIIVALLSEFSKFLGSMLRPLVAMTYPIPKIAVFPLLLVIFGIGDESKIAVISIGVFFLVFLSTGQGIRRLRSAGYLDLAAAYRIPFFKCLVQIVLRGILPDILAGLRAGVGYGLVMAIAGEFTVGNSGLGVAIWNAWDQFRIVDVYCGLAVLSVTGLFIQSTIEWIAKRSGEAI